MGTHRVAMDLTGRIACRNPPPRPNSALAYPGVTGSPQPGRGWEKSAAGPKYRQDGGRELASRVHVEADPEVQALYPGPAQEPRVQVELKDGRRGISRLYDLKNVS